jgi:protein-L-isoaspartate(D-aspartate) O-methyltransferase
MQIDLIHAKRILFKNLSNAVDSKSVIEAMEMVPRDRFVPPESRHLAYMDIALAIGEGQTISQPYMVAIMTKALGLRDTDRVLEVGTGSGYQAAVLSLLTPNGKVVTVELITSLAKRAETLLAELGYANVEVREAGPTLGCPSLGPFDAIIVAAAAPRLSESLIGQMAVGGRMVAPVGTRKNQELIQVLRTGEGLSIQALGRCRFVPLIGEEAFPKD